jgi:hypothetical protein
MIHHFNTSKTWMRPLSRLQQRALLWQLPTGLTIA